MRQLFWDIIIFLIIAAISATASFQFLSVLKTNELVVSMQKKQTAMEKRIINIEKWTVPVGEETKDEMLLSQQGS